MKPVLVFGLSLALMSPLAQASTGAIHFRGAIVEPPCASSHEPEALQIHLSCSADSAQEGLGATTLSPKKHLIAHLNRANASFVEIRRDGQVVGYELLLDYK